MIILDTNVISGLMQKKPESAVIDWLDRQPAESIWTTAVCVFEIRFGLAVLPAGKRRQNLQEAFDTALSREMDGRVLEFDSIAATQAAIIAAKLRSIGRSVEMRDVMIAGIVAAHHGTLATRNVKHFKDAGVALVDPWHGPK